MANHNSEQYNEEEAAFAQKLKTDAFLASQSPRPYANGLKFSTLISINPNANLMAPPETVLTSSIFPTSSLITDVGGGVGGGDIGGLTSPLLSILSPPRPIDSNEIAANNPPLISNLTKQVFDKNKFKETIDVTFTQLGIQNQPDPSFFDVSLATLEDFWILYDQFFFDIPKDGDTNSHAYLARTSGDYANFEFIQEQIQELLDEIAEIRTENVDLRIENINLTVTGSELAAALSAATT